MKKTPFYILFSLTLFAIFCCVTILNDEEINEKFRKMKIEYEEKMKNLPEPKPVDPDFLAYKNKIIGTIMRQGFGHTSDLDEHNHP
jgi:hypothetical protein